jgi:autotransporter translocation and assembly factor TamB
MSFARRSLQVVAFICTLIVGVTSMAVIVTQTTWFKEWLRGFIVRQSKDYLNGQLSIGHLGGNLFFGVDLDDVNVAMNGKTVVDVKNVGLDYNAFTFIKGDIVLDTIKIEQPVLRLEQMPDGAWNLARLVKVRTPDKPNSNRTLEIGELGVADGTLYVDAKPVGTSGVAIPSRIERLDASLGIKSNANELAFDINHVSLRAAEPEFGINSLKGVVRKSDTEVVFHNVSLRTQETMLDVDGTVKNLDSKTPIVSIKASSPKFSTNEVSQIVPALRGYNLEPQFQMTASGPADRLAVDVQAREHSVGKIDAKATVDAMTPSHRLAGTASVEGFNVGPVVKSTEFASDITGDARYDLAFPAGHQPTGTFAVKAPHVKVAGYEARNIVADGHIDGRTVDVNGKADAYGGEATTNGRIVAGQPLMLDLKGRAAHVDLRNLPPALKAPGVPSNLQFAYTITLRGQDLSAVATLEPSTLAGASIADGPRAEFSMGNGAPRYAAEGRVADLDLQQIGKGFAIAALDDDRYRSRVNGSFTMNGSGGGQYPLTINATGTLEDSQLFDASIPHLDFTTNLADGDVHVKAAGQFANLDPGKVSGNEKIAGNVSGGLDVDTTLRDYASGITPDSVEASGHIDLGESTIGGIRVDSAAVEGQFANRTGNIDSLSITGPDLTVTGQGPIALDETGSSKVSLHVEVPSLETIGKVVDRPLTGSATVDAWVNGNGNQLYLTGTLIGSDIGQGENNVLSVTSNFDVIVPQLDMHQVTAHANSTGNFLQVGGQRINYFTADTTYSQSKVQFTTTAQQQARELTAAGALILHPDHQEIHLPELSLRSQGVVWSIAPGSEATIQYGDDRVEVKNVQLENGDQRITADGGFGAPGESVQIQAANVDVSQLNQLALGNPGEVQGRLMASATVSGTTSEPHATGNFTLSQGAFRQFRFDSFGGQVDYSPRGVNLDVKLQENSTQWITAKGFAPVSLLRSSHAGTPDRQEGGEPVDIQVESSPIDLGLIQGFTSDVTNVTGTIQANFKVQGTGYDPHLNGTVDVRNGSLQVPDLGTTYTGIDTHIDMMPDAVKVGEMRIVDNHGSAMTIGGQLAVHEREVGGVDVSVKSRDFKMIDNELGNVRVNTDLHLTGELRWPRLEGTLGIETGTLEVAKILQRIGERAYSTAPAVAPTDDHETATQKVISNAEIPANADAKTSNAGADTAPNVAAVAKAQEDATGAEATPAPPSPSLFDSLSMNLQLTVPDDLVVKGQGLKTSSGSTSFGDVNVTIGGDVYVTKSPLDIMRLTGDVRTIRGFYTFQGRRFEILRDGTVRFIGGNEIDPSLSITASRVIQSVETFIDVKGSLSKPELTFRSNPPLEQADILSLIIFNQPVNELGEGQQASLSQRAADLATGYVASGLARSIGNALNLNEFEIHTQDESGAAASVAVGQQVGKNLYFRLVQAFGGAQTTQFILEYQLAQFLRLRGTAADTSTGTQRIQFRRVERGGIDLIFFFAY